MDANSSKPVETTNPQVSALALARDWVLAEGSSSRPGHLVATLINASFEAVSRGDEPPEKDSATLAAIWREEMHTGSQDPSPLRSSAVEAWWGAHRQALIQRCQDAGCTLMPALHVLPGGGRGVQTRYRLQFVPTPDAESEEPAAAEVADPDQIVYRVDPAKPSWWLRLLLGRRPFPVASWRGYILLGSAVVNFLLIGLLWWVLWATWSTPQPVTTARLAEFGVTAALTGLLWWLTGPVRKLPTQRVTLAGPAHLAFNELFGQLRTMPEGSGKDRRRIFAVVRHWGNCPVCSAEVDLDDGGRAFPDRLVGRCHDAPTEHVFSFDPVRLVGQRLNR